MAEAALTLEGALRQIIFFPAWLSSDTKEAKKKRRCLRCYSLGICSAMCPVLASCYLLGPCAASFLTLLLLICLAGVRFRS